MTCKYSAWILLSLGLSGCAGWSQTQPEFAELAQKASALEPRANQTFHILAGELAAKRGLTADAAAHYLAAAEWSGDAELASRGARLALASGNLELATRGAEAWVKADPGSASAHELRVRLALRRGDLDAARAGLRQLVANNADGPGGGLVDVAVILSGEAGDVEQTLALLEDLGAAYPELPETHYATALLATRLERPTLARAAIEKALTLRPGWREAQIVAMRTYLASGERSLARRLIEDLHAAEPGNIELRMMLGRLLLDANEFELAAGEFQAILKLDSNQHDALYALGLLALDRGQDQVARRYFEQLFADGARGPDAAYYLGRIAEENEQFSAAIAWYEKVGHGNRQLDAGIRIAVIMARLQRVAEAREYLGNLRAVYPQQELRLYQAEAEILYEVQDFASALAIYEAAIRDYPDDPDLYYGRALVAERAGQVELAIADLRRLVALNPEDARALNALGYILSNHTTQFAEAADYIAAALEITPEDAAVIDSMGWVQYRLGNLDVAREYLEDAYARFADPEVAAHLGEVLWMLGETARASEIWDAALRKAPNHPVLNEAVKRLRP